MPVPTPGALLVGVCMFSLRRCGFSPCTRDSCHSPNHIVNSDFSHESKCESKWFLGAWKALQPKLPRVLARVPILASPWDSWDNPKPPPQVQVCHINYFIFLCRKQTPTYYWSLFFFLSTLFCIVASAGCSVCREVWHWTFMFRIATLASRHSLSSDNCRLHWSKSLAVATLASCCSGFS